jgi:hypothetical protein
MVTVIYLNFQHLILFLTTIFGQSNLLFFAEFDTF